MVNKAGKNYIFDIGKLIGKQFELDEKDLTRDNDIFISYAKSINNEISINIPAGFYRPSGSSNYIELGNSIHPSDTNGTQQSTNGGRN